MKQYEAKRIKGTEKDITKELNKMSSERWNLHSFSHDFYVFEKAIRGRPKAKKAHQFV